MQQLQCNCKMRMQGLPQVVVQVPFKHDLQRRYSGLREPLRRVLLSAEKTRMGEGAVSAKRSLHHSIGPSERSVG